MSSKLTIYKASAGSGKTYTLTRDYLKLIFNPYTSFKNILAVTFTNKATNEMRERILKAIYDLANGNDSGYKEVLCNEYKLTESQLKEKAQRILNQMLNQYGHFKISTIDSFFQQIIKSVAYELDLTNGFTLELDDARILDEAVATIINNFDAKTAEGKWMLKAVEESVDQGKSWKIDYSLGEFAKKIFRQDVDFDDDNQQGTSEDRLANIVEYKKELEKIIADFTSKFLQRVQELKKIYDESGFTENDFKNKSRGVASVIKKFTTSKKVQDIGELNKTAIKARNSIEEWSADTNMQQQITTIGLYSAYVNVCSLFDYENIVAPNTASVILSQLNNYAFVERISSLRRKICSEQNLFLLSSAMPFLEKMIDKSDAPFIYERVGYKLKNFMIDEFQDTSTSNWNNFLPLMINGLSESDSLIVGDVKQAIYRWRGGDWNLLDNQVQTDLRMFNIDVQNLEYNWRSDRNVILFNNWFLEHLKNNLQGIIDENVLVGRYEDKYSDIFRRTYDNLSQKIPPKKVDNDGFVSIDILDDKNNKDSFVQTWLITQIDRLIELGYKPGDIAILVRTKRQAARIAQHLANAQITYPEKASNYIFVSNESVKLGYSKALRLIVAAIEFLINPNDKLVKSTFVWQYFFVTQSAEMAAKMIQQVDFTGSSDEVLALMPQPFVDLKDKYKQLDIVQLCSKLIRIFFGLSHQIQQADIPYLNEFEDRVHTFNERYGSNLQQFVEWWKQKGNSTDISMNEEQNAIQVMTIHKSKGLEFKSVLFPYTDFNEQKGKDIKLVKVTQAPFDKFSPMPVQFSSKLEQTIFKKEYYEEQFMQNIDNLNVFYVAFTRAVKDLRICHTAITKSDPKKEITTSLSINDAINTALNDIECNAEISALAQYDKENNRFTFGIEKPYQSTITDVDAIEVEKMHPCKNHAKITIKCHSEEFFTGVDFDKERNINTGNLYHKIFEKVKYTADVEKAVKLAVTEGLVNEKEEADFVKRISKFVDKQPQWFDSKWEVLTEQSVMLETGEIKRPDRILESDTELIVIDYKFTNKRNEIYNKQVRSYIDVLQQLTSKKVKGYLWYVWPNEAVEVVVE